MNNARMNGIWKQIAEVIQMATPIAAVIGAAMVVGYAAYSVFTLFRVHIQAGVPEAVLATVASVGVSVVVTALALTSSHKPTRALSGIFATVWALIVLCLVSLSAALSSDLLVTFDALVGIGQVVAAGLAGLALIPALLIPASMQHKDVYETVGAANGHYFGLLVKAVVIGTSSFATGYFGITRGVPVAVAALCALLLETSFLWAYTQLIKARESRDRFDVGVWCGALVLFGLFISLVSVETLSTLGGVKVPILAPLQEAGAVLFVSAAGLSIALTVIAHLATTMIDMRAPAPVGSGLDTAEGLNVFKRPEAVPQLNQNGPAMPALKPGNTNWDEVDRNLEAGLRRRRLQEAQAGGPKMSESGQRYDATGTFVMEDSEPASIFSKEASGPK